MSMSDSQATDSRATDSHADSMFGSRSSRFDGDTWDLGSSVGATATAVAASRVLATRSGLIDDPIAERLVRAVGLPQYLDVIDQTEVSGEAARGLQRMAEGMANRTRFFDDFCADAMASGIRQVVILASGLDTRPYRLAWPSGTVIFEIDQPLVLEFKSRALQHEAISPTATLRTVPIDLREDWRKALTMMGFDPNQRTAWLAEGLLMYLQPADQDRLLMQITGLSPAGSELGTEFVPDIKAFSEDPRWNRYGFKVDFAGLVYQEERSNLIDYLTALNWRVSGSLVHELLVANGFDHGDGDDMASRFDGFQYIRAMLT